MNFTETELPGVWLLDLDPRTDDRGLFARAFCREEFRRHGLVPDVEQCNVSHNPRRGTLRGLHWQRPPGTEVRLVRCSRGAAWDVVVDVGPESPTFGRWVGVELTADNRRSVYVPVGFAHGFITLCDDTELHYQMSAAFDPALAAGVRYDDPDLAIAWPLPPTVISERDRRLPSLGRAVRRRTPAAAPPAPAPPASAPPAPAPPAHPWTSSPPTSTASSAS